MTTATPIDNRTLRRGHRTMFARLSLGLFAGLGLAAAALTSTGCEGKEDSKTPAKTASETKPTAAPGSSTPTTGTKAAPEAAPGDAILIGHYGSLTGSKATFGKSTDNGIKLAVEEINAAGGVSIAGGPKKKIKLISQDTEGKADQAGNVVTRLITQDKVVAVLGEVASGITLAAAPVAQQFGVPMITPSSTNPEVTQKGDMIFRVCFIDPFQGLACAKFVHNDLKFTKVALLVDQASPYSVGLKQEFVKGFTGMGGKIVSEQTYNEGDSDFNAQLARIRESAPEAIFIPGYYTEVSNIAIQARKLGMNLPLVGGDGWDSEDLAKNAGKAIEGCFYSNHYAPDQPTKEITEFVTKYKKNFGGTPDGLAALGYDAANILFDSMTRAKSLKGKDLRDAIAATRDYKAVTGNISIDKDRNAVKAAVIVEMKNGVPVYKATVNP